MDPAGFRARGRARLRPGRPPPVPPRAGPGPPPPPATGNARPLRPAPKLVFPPADPADVAALVNLYDRHYRGGYSACFDRYGPAPPPQLLWERAVKSGAVG